MTDDECLKLILAALRRMEEKYYTLQGKNGKVRYQERPIAYEFYYQLRKILEEMVREKEVVLHGELDKRFQHHYPSCARKMPDFILHVPGKPENYAVIELKLASRSFKDILKDIEKLKCFREKLGYITPVLILFGKKKDLEDRLNKIREIPGIKSIYILGYNLNEGSIIQLTSKSEQLRET